MLVFITSTTYGTWLPGDERGFVSPVRGVLHNKFGTPYEANIGGLKKFAQSKLSGEPILLTPEQAQILFDQFQESTSRRYWQIYGLAIMPNHFHVLLELPRDVAAEKALGVLKSYGSRALNRCFGKPAGGTWWTESGSTRRKDEESIPNVIRYIKQQKNALVIWIDPRYDVD